MLPAIASRASRVTSLRPALSGLATIADRVGREGRTAHTNSTLTVPSIQLTTVAPMAHKPFLRASGANTIALAAGTQWSPSTAIIARPDGRRLKARSTPILFVWLV